MRAAGTHLFPTMDRVIFGKPAAQTLSDEVERLDKRRVFLMVSHTLNSKTNEIEKIRSALEGRCVGLFDRVPQHTSRRSAAAAAQAAANVEAELIVAIGGGSVVDASKIMLVCMEHKIFEPKGLDGFEFKIGPAAFRKCRPTGRPRSE
jgi:maleylacetate reductase